MMVRIVEIYFFLFLRNKNGAFKILFLTQIILKTLFSDDSVVFFKDFKEMLNFT